MPHCKKCDRDHFNFTPCAMVDTFDADRAEKARRLQNLAKPTLRPRENDWGNRYERSGYQQIAPNVVVLRRPPIHSVTRPDFKQGEK